MLGNIYAYSKDDLFSKQNTVFELHYSTIFDLKKICPSMITIYIFPENINMAKEETIKRHLKPEVEKQRLLEIDEHYHKIMTDKNLRNQFDYFIYNSYNKRSENEMLKLVEKILYEER